MNPRIGALVKVLWLRREGGRLFFKHQDNLLPRSVYLHVCIIVVLIAADAVPIIVLVIVTFDAVVTVSDH